MRDDDLEIAGVVLDGLKPRDPWRGWLPPPDTIRAYEGILPGSLDRILRMAEQSQQAGIEETARARALAARDMRRGQWLGFAASALAIAGTVACSVAAAAQAAPGLYAVATALVSVPIMGVARALVESTRHPAPAPGPAIEQPVAQLA